MVDTIDKCLSLSLPVLYLIRHKRAREGDSMAKAPVPQQSSNLVAVDIMEDFAKFPIKTS